MTDDERRLLDNLQVASWDKIALRNAPIVYICGLERQSPKDREASCAGCGVKIYAASEPPKAHKKYCMKCGMELSRKAGAGAFHGVTPEVIQQLAERVLLEKVRN